jgi:hypothetical protein
VRPLPGSAADKAIAAFMAADPHVYDDDQEALLFRDEGDVDECFWPSENDRKYLILQWWGAAAHV